MQLAAVQVCPFAGISVCATRISLQTEQCLPSVLPGSVQVGSTAASITSVWPLAAISSVSTASQPSRWQLRVFSPFSVQVASVVTVQALQSWPSASPSVAPQTEQVLGSVQLAAVQVCPLAGTSVCATRTSLQTEQCLPSVLPGSVQVGSTAASITSVCPLAAISSVSTASQPSRWQLRVFSPFSVQVASVVTVQALQSWPSASPSVAPQTEQVLGSVQLAAVQVCPLAGTSVCATRTSLQTEQCLPSVLPGTVQVGSTAASVTSV